MNRKISSLRTSSDDESKTKEYENYVTDIKNQTVSYNNYLNTYVL